MPKKNSQNKNTPFIKCKKCNAEIYGNTGKKMTPCKCGAVSVDGCEYYVRVIGNIEDYEEIKK